MLACLVLLLLAAAPAIPTAISTGATSPSSSDGPISGVDGVLLSAGGTHTCGLTDPDGFAECWGSDRCGGQSSSPTGVTFTSISAGFWHTCGVRTDGNAECWGWNGYDQLSAMGVTFTTISAGFWHTCGVRTDGNAECWGNNDFGQSSPPAGVTFTSISTGRDHTCGVRTNGNAECWGWDWDGQASSPAGVTFTSISAGWLHTCGVRTDGTAECWGDTSYGKSSPPDGLVFGDRTGPTVVASRSPAPNDAGWHNGPVTIGYVCTDGWSGVATCPAPVTVDTDGRDQDVSATGSDRAGNTTIVHDLISIDSVAPAATIAKANVEVGQISGTATDTLSGPALVTVTLRDALGIQAVSTVTATLACNESDTAAAIACTWTADAPSGVWIVTVTATDLADNTVTSDGGIIVVT
jgi:hypothetical protein